MLQHQVLEFTYRKILPFRRSVFLPEQVFKYLICCCVSSSPKEQQTFLLIVSGQHIKKGSQSRHAGKKNHWSDLSSPL